MYISLNIGGEIVNLNKGQVAYEYESDLEYKVLVEDFAETATLTRSALSQFVNSVIELRTLKEKITLNKSSNIFYFISIRKLLDNIELKNTLKEVSEQREGISKGVDFLENKVEEYLNHISQDEDAKRVDIANNMFIGYTSMYMERVDKQVISAVKYLIRVKKFEVPDEEDKEYLAELENEILKNDAKMKMVISELEEIWLKISDSVIENIVDDIKVAMEEIVEDKEENEESTEDVAVETKE